MAKELAEVNKFEVFKVFSKGKSPPPGYKRIPYSFVFDVMLDLRRKARIVATGCRIGPTGESCYSGVVPIDAVRLALFLSELSTFL